MFQMQVFINFFLVEMLNFLFDSCFFFIQVPKSDDPQALNLIEL